MFKKSAVALISFLLGVIFGIVLLVIYLYPSPLNETATWKKPTQDFILTANDGGKNIFSFPFSHHSQFMLTKMLDGKSTEYGHIVTVDNTFENYQTLDIKWLETGCMITTKDGYELFIPYPSDTGRI